MFWGNLCFGKVGNYKESERVTEEMVANYVMNWNVGTKNCAQGSCLSSRLPVESNWQAGAWKNDRKGLFLVIGINNNDIMALGHDWRRLFSESKVVYHEFKVC